MRKPKDRGCAGTKPSAYQHLMLMVPVLLLVLSMISQASASTVTDLVTFEASGFTEFLGGSVPAPVDPVTGSFTISFDPTQTYSVTTTGITLNSLNLTQATPMGFDYSPTAQPGGFLTVGGVTAGNIEDVPGTNDFYLLIYGFTTAPSMAELLYGTSSSGEVRWSAYTGTVTVSAVSAVPLPASALLFGSGLLGLLGWRKLRKS